MQIRQYVPLSFIIVLSIWVSSCTKHAEGIAGPAGPPGLAGSNGDSISPSAINGFVALFNQYGNPDSSNAGVTLSTSMGDSIETATTDSTGKFSFPPLPPGNYDIIIKKQGFDSLKVFVQHSAGNEPKFIGDVRMDASLTTKITSETVNLQKDVFGDNTLFVNISFTGAPSTYQTLTNFNFYFSRSKNLSMQNYDVMENGDNEATLTNSYQFEYDITNISAAGISYSPGDTVYVKTYISPVPNSVSSWFNYSTNMTVSYPYVGDSAVNYFVWPQ